MGRFSGSSSLSQVSQMLSRMTTTRIAEHEHGRASLNLPFSELLFDAWRPCAAYLPDERLPARLLELHPHWRRGTELQIWQAELARPAQQFSAVSTLKRTGRLFIVESTM